jgi:hypothetical protein
MSATALSAATLARISREPCDLRGASFPAPLCDAAIIDGQPQQEDALAVEGGVPILG